MAEAEAQDSEPGVPMTVIPIFKHSRTQRDSGAAAELRQLSTMKYTNDNTHSPEASPGVSGRLLAWVIAAGVFTVVAAFVWWAA